MISYVVTEPNKAHVVVTMGKGRKVYHPSKEGAKSSYWYIPMLMRRIIISLENVKHEINNIVLHDKKVAPFQCDITCWFKITDPELAAEKLDVDADGNIMTSIKETLNAQVQGVARNAAMQQEILELMSDRMSFGESVFKTVNGDLDEWGVQLVKLEIIDFADADGGHVIEDYEKRREAEINSLTRQTVADQEQQASVKESLAKKASEQARIDSEQQVSMKDLERQQTVQTRAQAARLAVAEQQEKANAKEVAAARTKVLGEAQYTADAMVVKSNGDAQARAKVAEGEKQALTITAEGRAAARKTEAAAEAEATLKTGTAAADVIQKTGEAEAAATEKKADAQKKFTDASKEIEMAKIAADIQKTKYNAMATSMSNAKVQVISPDMKFMGFGAEEGAGLGALVSALEKATGITVGEVVDKVTGKGK